ncbi:MAG: ATP-binding protein [Planctomycetes bacterium]|nr:ATP-binding protein [Planctomycetota bacterium]
MIRLIEALNFRCLRYVSRPLDRFHMLVGPNASGKTTFLDVIAFLGDMVSEGLDYALSQRAESFGDLLFGRQGDWFELAVEVAIPSDRGRELPPEKFDTIRYEVRIGVTDRITEPGILLEKVWLKRWKPPAPRPRAMFPLEPDAPASLVSPKGSGRQTVLTKSGEGGDNFYSEVRMAKQKGWFPSIRLGPRKSALATLPDDESKFPVSTWLKGFLTTGIQRCVLNSLLIRRASLPEKKRGFKPDGSNLPWVIAELAKRRPDKYAQWISHLRTALPDIETIKTVEQEDDKRRHLVVRYNGGLEVPSWMASDGTLRMLALTLPAYVPEFRGVYLVEEPENGLHPLAVEVVSQSLSSVYGAQVLVASHSPVILSLMTAKQVLCFQKGASGATDIVAGTEHPALRDWKADPNLGTMFASGVLG